MNSNYDDHQVIILLIEPLRVIVIQEIDDLSYDNPLRSDFLILDCEHYLWVALTSVIGQSSASETFGNYLYNACHSFPPSFFFTFVWHFPLWGV